MKTILNRATVVFNWPGLHNMVQRMPPITPQPAPYAASYTFNWLSASGTSCLFAVIVSAIVLRVSPAQACALDLACTAKQLALPELTIAATLGAGVPDELFRRDGYARPGVRGHWRTFPFFSSLLGWIGVFLTGSDTSANALFGSLQVVTASRLGFNPALMAAANSSGGVMGKMISLQSIAVAAAATGMARSDEGKLFRFTLRHSIFMAAVVGMLTLFYAYVMPGWVK